MNNRRRNDYDDRGSSGRRSAGKGWSFSTIVIVVGLVILWGQAQDGSGTKPAPHTHTVCTQYFTAGCPGGKWTP